MIQHTIKRGARMGYEWSWKNRRNQYRHQFGRVAQERHRFGRIALGRPIQWMRVWPR